MIKMQAIMLTITIPLFLFAIVINCRAAPSPKLVEGSATKQQYSPEKCLKTLKIYGDCNLLKDVDVGKTKKCIEQKSENNKIYLDKNNSNCHLPRKFGNKCLNGRKTEILWYWNSRLGKCKAFEFLGCNGNENQFKTKTACIHRCGLQLRKEKINVLKYDEDIIEEMPHRNEKEFLSRKTHSPKAELLKDKEKDKHDICSLEKDVGICRALIPRYFYNGKSSLCESFNYGGCGGNENNFKTHDECKGRCESNFTNENVCSLDPDSGPCEAIQIRYYYNKAEQKCKKFAYGGCDGNQNRFNSERECLSKCQ